MELFEALLQITEENHHRLEDKIADLGSVRSISLKVSVDEIRLKLERLLLGPSSG